MTSRVAKSRADNNATLLKGLLRQSSNKFCCDCKTADHPRWASWNLGIFLCIRCSGIHRSLGTHISRVKSVDLDAWTDEQARSMVIWGNERANSYWEAKLEDNYTPSDARVDAFIKAKYVARKWAASTETPDPSTLSVDSQTTIVKTEQPDRTIHADHGPSPERFAQRRLRSPAREIKPQESLLGLDFTTQPQPRASQSREAGSSASCATNVDLLTSTDTPSSGSLFADRHASIKLSEPKPGRNDLKMSIMSLYASAPRSQSLRSHETAPNSMHTSWSAPKRPVADGTSRPGAFDELTGLFGGMNVNSAARGSQALQPSQRPIPQAQSTATRGTTQAQEPLDPWGAYNTDEFGGFQSGAHSPSQTKSNVPVTGAFDDLYSTSDVWK